MCDSWLKNFHKNFRSKVLILLFISLFGFSKILSADFSSDLLIWFDSPATVFTQSLPLGNGRLGAMVYGGVGEEPIVLNEGTLWSKILPALPDAWAHGNARGLRARGGFEVDMIWKNRKLTQIALRSNLGGDCRLSYDGKTTTVKTKAGKTYKISPSMFN